MGRSRRKFKKGKPKVRVGLPQTRRPSNQLPKAQTLILPSKEVVEWNVDGTLTGNYGSAGFVLDPNQAVRLRPRVPPAAVQLASIPEARPAPFGHRGSEEGEREAEELEGAAQSAEEDEPEELQVTLGKRRKSGAAAPRYERLTKMQRVHVGRLMEKHGLDYKAMAKDLKLNRLQQTAGQLRFLCARYLAYEKQQAGAGLDREVLSESVEQTAA